MVILRFLLGSTVSSISNEVTTFTDEGCMVWGSRTNDLDQNQISHLWIMSPET